jgi:hypothetical protein
MRLPAVNHEHGVIFCPRQNYNRQLFFSEHLQYTSSRLFLSYLHERRTANTNTANFLPPVCRCSCRFVVEFSLTKAPGHGERRQIKAASLCFPCCRYAFCGKISLFVIRSVEFDRWLHILKKHVRQYDRAESLILRLKGSRRRTILFSPVHR